MDPEPVVTDPVVTEQKTPEIKTAKTTKKVDPAPQDVEPAKVSLTVEELELERQKARDAVKAELAAQAQKDKEAAEKQAAKDQGKWQELATQTEQKLAEKDAENSRLKTEAKRVQVREDVREYLREHHAGYVGSEKWILPAIQFDLTTAQEDVTKRIKSAADSYVKDNPRTKQVSTPSQAGGSNSGNSASGKARPQNGSTNFREFSGAASRF